MNTNPEDIAQLHNELRRIDIAIDQKKKILESLIGQNPTPKRTRQKNKRYSVELEFVPGELVPQTNHFVVDKQTIFRPMSIDWSLRVNLSNEDVLLNITPGIGDAFTAATGTAARNVLFSFLLGVSDTGSNREWQNAPIPDTFLLGGILAPFYFGFGERAVLSADTLVSFEIQPTLSSTAINDDDTTLNVYSVLIGMSGHEEILNG